MTSGGFVTALQRYQHTYGLLKVALLTRAGRRLFLQQGLHLLQDSRWTNGRALPCAPTGRVLMRSRTPHVALLDSMSNHLLLNTPWHDTYTTPSLHICVYHYTDKNTGAACAASPTRTPQHQRWVGSFFLARVPPRRGLMCVCCV